jgi:flagellar hook-associated protein 2
MSTTPITSSTSTSTGTTDGSGSLSSLGAGTPMQITGLASGLNTNQIITELMALKQQPVTQAQTVQAGLTALNTQLANIQTSLQAVAADASALGNPSLFSSSQTITSTNPAVSGATSTGAGVGGYQIGVSQLANSSQRTFTFTPPATADVVTIDGHTTNVAAGATAQSFANSINNDPNATVYAAATDAGTIVMSSRATGTTGAGIATTDTAGALTEQTGLARAGQDAIYTVDGGSPLSSHSNTVTGAIAGVTLTLSGLTTTSGPATINVSAPAPSSSGITAAVQQFVTDYNSAIKLIGTQLAQQKSTTDPTQGTLTNDGDLTNMLSTMRDAMYASGSGLPAGMSSLLNLGVSTGAASGGAAPSAAALSGTLTIDPTALASAIQANPTGVQTLLETFSGSFSGIVNAEAQPGGSIGSRIAADTSQISDLATQITNMQASLADQQAQLTQQYAALESSLSQNQSMSTWLTGQIASLPGS